MTVHDAALIITILFLALAWLAVALRCFVRIRMLNSFGLDDCFIVISAALFAVLSSSVIKGTRYYDSNGDPEAVIQAQMQALKFQLITEVTYTVATCTLKVSIALLLLRLSQRRRYIFILRFSIAFTCIYSAVCFFLTLFQCRPIQLAWGDRSTGEGTCLSSRERGGIAYAFSALAIVTDWLYAILPVFMLMDVKMSTPLKLYVTLVLGLGALACIATIVRLTYIVQLVQNGNGFTPAPLVSIWTIVEPGIGILAASAATLRPLLQYLKFAGLADSSQGSGAWPRSHSSWHELSRVKEEGVKANKVLDHKSATNSDVALCESERSESFIVHAK